MTLKRTQVMLLPTEQKGNALIFRENQLMWQNKHSAKNDRKHHITKYFHLYILSDDKIKEGDWFIDLRDKDNLCWEDIYCAGYGGSPEFANTIGKKIIATTDSSLASGKGLDSFSGKPNLLPRPSEDFIKVFVEAYNKNDIIKYVDVEYEHSRPGDCGCRGMVHDSCAWVDDVYNIKVNSKNEMSIRKIKDTWSREEVKLAFMNFLKDNKLSGISGVTVSKWIEKNLS